MESSYAIGQNEVIRSTVQFVALAAFLIPTFPSIPRIGWSRLNQWTLGLIRLRSLGCGPLLLLPRFVIDQQAGSILRRHDLTIGFLGASRSKIDRLVNARGG